MANVIDFIPPNTAIAWTDGKSLFVRYPTKEGTPYITRQPLSQSGLMNALNLIIEYPMPVTVHQPGPPANHPAVKRQKTEFSDSAKDAARIALAKIGAK